MISAVQTSRCVFALLAALFLPQWASAAAELPDFFRYQIPFPSAPSDAAEAKKWLPYRIEAVTRFLACGKEIEFLHRMNDTDAGKRASEDFLTIALGKLAWLQATELTGKPCAQRIRIAAEADLEPDEWGLPPRAVLGQPSLFPVLRVTNLNNAMKAAFGGRCIADIITANQYIQDTSVAHPVDVFEVDLTVSRECLRQQVNAALKKVEIVGLLGSSDLPCGLAGLSGIIKSHDGEGDVAVRDLTRILYLDHNYSKKPNGISFLNDDTYRHVRDDLLSVSGPKGDESYSPYSCGNQERSTGTPQELADEREWLDEAIDSIGDFFKWLAHFITEISVVAAAAGIAFFVPGSALLVPVVVAGALLVRIPETENHLLMIETSRYLKNQIIIEALGPNYDNVDKYYDDQKALKGWLLDRLQSYSVVASVTR